MTGAGAAGWLALLRRRSSAWAGPAVWYLIQTVPVPTVAGSPIGWLCCRPGIMRGENKQEI